MLYNVAVFILTEIILRFIAGTIFWAIVVIVVMVPTILLVLFWEGLNRRTGGALQEGADYIIYGHIRRDRS